MAPVGEKTPRAQQPALKDIITRVEHQLTCFVFLLPKSSFKCNSTGEEFLAGRSDFKSGRWKCGSNKRFLGSCGRSENALPVPPLRPRRCALEARTAHSVTSEAEPTDMTVSSQHKRL